jgi:hypothetical protein
MSNVATMNRFLHRTCVCVSIFVLAASVMAGDRITWKLTTPTYTITIIGCVPGDFLCKDVSATARNRVTGETVRLQGVSYGLGNCDADVGNCRWGGFELKEGAHQYNVSRDGALVKRTREKSVREQGLLEEVVH